MYRYRNCGKQKNLKSASYKDFITSDDLVNQFVLHVDIVNRARANREKLNWKLNVKGTPFELGRISVKRFCDFAHIKLSAFYAYPDIADTITRYCEDDDRQIMAFNKKFDV